MNTNTRQCQTCCECCVHTPVASFDKPRGEACRHQLLLGQLPVLNDATPCAGRCGIYSDKPSECATYKCSWLDGRLHEALKPEQCGLLFETGWIDAPRRVEFLMGFELRPGRVARYRPQLEASSAPGRILIMVPYDEIGPLVVIGEPEDLAAWTAFMEGCRAAGEIGMRHSDGLTRIRI